MPLEAQNEAPAAEVCIDPSWNTMPREPALVEIRMSPSITVSFEAGAVVPTPTLPPRNHAEGPAPF